MRNSILMQPQKETLN